MYRIINPRRGLVKQKSADKLTRVRVLSCLEKLREALDERPYLIACPAIDIQPVVFRSQSGHR